MTTKLSGKIFAIEAPISGTGYNGQWKRQNLIVQTVGEYPKTICFVIKNDKIDISSFQIGEMVTVSFNIESNKPKERWITNFVAWRIERTTEESSLYISGTIATVFGETLIALKNGSTKAKQDFVLQTDDKFPKSIYISIWGERDKSLLKNNETVNVNLEISSSKSMNGIWYSNVQAMSISKSTTIADNQYSNNTIIGNTAQQIMKNAGIEILTQNDILNSNEIDNIFK